MKLFVSTMTLTLSLAGASLAQSQLERNLGVEPGRYTTQELAILKVAAEQNGEGARVFFSPTTNTVASSHGTTVTRASAILAEIAEAGDDTAYRAGAERAGGVTFSGQPAWSAQDRHDGGNS